ncbi:glycoside hydrolase family 37 protein [Patellaria atrata CBS 101060]|uniref:Trehalase n=1 Tax=Patellaria atrata CBS 101060 TaxID=1346257 RepID=A0A9P4S2K3_9PEZI|nr:glycoside hydrolase family 37 protein [Patellaria atrata CBS 101060]
MAIIPGPRIWEDPVERLNRLIDDTFWVNLTRAMDGSLIKAAAVDPKDWTLNPRPRIYIPPKETRQLEYYRKVAKEQPELNLDVQSLPVNITVGFYRQMNENPGVLALDMEEVVTESGEKTLKGVPFVVPGGRFNELYGWDSYFSALGLLSSGRADLAKGIVKNFVFEIQHYGLIPNANRTYYLLRSQPPFLTDLTLRTYNVIRHEPGAKEFLRRAILAAIKEYNTVWTTEPRLDPETGLSRFRPAGLGIPLECETEHFKHILAPYLKKHDMSYSEFVDAYNSGKVKEPDLDTYFLHDRAVRESGNDVSLRLERVCADIATVDLNSLLYKYETDIRDAIRKYFDDQLVVPVEFCAPGQEPNHVESSASWDRKAKKRQQAMNKYLWNEKEGYYFDYDTNNRRQGTYQSVCTFYPLWCGAASPRQAASVVAKGLPLFERIGGLTVGTEMSRKELESDCHPDHQWDYPYGWAPHQLLAWDGLRRYGFQTVAQRVCYRWLYIITKVFVDFNGTVCEKYNVTQTINPHRVDAEYGNQGVDFKGYAKEGFGWTNASYAYGLQILSVAQKRALATVTPWEIFAGKTGLKAEDEDTK